MSFKEFEKYLSKSAKPIRFNTTDRPKWAQGIPDEKLHSGFASGSIAPAEGSANVTDQIGGIDIFRHAEPKDGVNLNKDHYYVVKDPEEPDYLYVLGPYKEDPNSPSKEHHIDELPERLQKAKYFE